MAFRVEVTGPDEVTVRVRSPHPAVTVEDGEVKVLHPGTSSILLAIHPSKLDQIVTLAPILLHAAPGTPAAVDLTMTLRIVRNLPPHVSAWVIAAVFVAGLALGAALWGATRVAIPSGTATTHGQIHQLPPVAACLDVTPPPRPAYVDLHLDGLGRPTGFEATPSTEELRRCIQAALPLLSFPPSENGRATVHRYAVTESPSR
jgi:hypothetical protein